MRDGEGRNDFQDVHESGLRRCNRLPFSIAPQEHAWEQQSQKKKNVIVARPNVPYTLGEKGEKWWTRDWL